MLAGRVVQVDAPRALYDDALWPEVFLFLGYANPLPGVASGDAVETALGRLPLRRARQGRVRVLVRPENLLISPDEAPNARVEHIEFYGDRQLIRVKLDGHDGPALELFCHAQDHYVVSQQVTISVRGAVAAFPA
jgi:ABC-type sugar transport system ATPase subunit